MGLSVVLARTQMNHNMNYIEGLCRWSWAGAMPLLFFEEHLEVRASHNFYDLQ